MKRIVTFLFLSAVMQTFFVHGTEIKNQKFYFRGNKGCKIQLPGELVKYFRIFSANIRNNADQQIMKCDVNKNVLNDVVSLLKKVELNGELKHENAKKLLQEKKFDHIKKCLKVADDIGATCLFDPLAKLLANNGINCYFNLEELANSGYFCDKVNPYLRKWAKLKLHGYQECSIKDYVKKVSLEKVFHGNTIQVTNKEITSLNGIDYLDPNNKSFTILALNNNHIFDQLSDPKFPHLPFKNFNHLVKLDLSGNNLEVLVKEMFYGLYALQELNLSKNTYMESIGTRVFEYLGS